MGETKKVQLAVRVPADVRDLCLDLARKVGMSKNVFVEKLIRAAAQAPNMHAPLEIPIDYVDPADEPTISETHTVRVDVWEEDPMRKAFAPNCKAGTLHWKHGPGNPCRFCDGEI